MDYHEAGRVLDDVQRILIEYGGDHAVRCEVLAPASVVVVAILYDAAGDVAYRRRYRGPLTAAERGDLIVRAVFLADDAGRKAPVATATAGRDGPEPMADWLQLTLLRISAVFCDERAKRRAVRFVKALEADGIPAAAAHADSASHGILLDWATRDAALYVGFHHADVMRLGCLASGVTFRGDYPLDSRAGVHHALYEFRWAMDIFRGRAATKGWYFEGIGGSDEGRHAGLRAAV